MAFCLTELNKYTIYTAVRNVQTLIISETLSKNIINGKHTMTCARMREPCSLRVCETGSLTDYVQG